MEKIFSLIRLNIMIISHYILNPIRVQQIAKTPQQLPLLSKSEVKYGKTANQKSLCGGGIPAATRGAWKIDTMGIPSVRKKIVIFDFFLHLLLNEHLL